MARARLTSLVLVLLGALLVGGAFLLDPILGLCMLAVVGFVGWNEYRTRDLTGAPPSAELPGETSMIDATGWGGIFLRTNRGRVLCLFGIEDEALFATAVPEDVALVLRFDGSGHHLPDARVLELFGQHPVLADRCGVQQVGELRLEPDEGRLQACWPGARALLGLGLVAVGLHPDVSVLVGTASVEPVPDLNALTRLKTVVLVEDGSGEQGRNGQFFSHMGVHAIVLGRRPQQDNSMLLLVAAETGGDLAIAKTASSDEVEQAAIGLLLNSRDEALERLAEAADQPVSWFQLGVLRTVQERPADAVTCMFRAAEAMPEAWASIASLRLQTGDQEGALQAAETAVEKMPGDPISQAVLEGVRSGQDPAYMVHRFTAHADLALDTARDFVGRGEDGQAELLLQRAVQLDPRHKDCYAVYWDLLKRQGRSDEARTLLERAQRYAVS